MARTARGRYYPIHTHDQYFHGQPNIDHSQVPSHIRSNPIIRSMQAELVRGGVKEGFAIEMVENSGTKPDEIIRNPADVLGEYWYTNMKEAVDFLDDYIAVDGVFSFLPFMPMTRGYI